MHTPIDHGFLEGRVKCLTHHSLRDAREGLAPPKCSPRLIPRSAPAVAWRWLRSASLTTRLCPISQVRQLWSGSRHPPEATLKDKQHPQDRCPVISTSPALWRLPGPHGASRSVLCTQCQGAFVSTLFDIGPVSGGSSRTVWGEIWGTETFTLSGLSLHSVYINCCVSLQVKGQGLWGRGWALPHFSGMSHVH